MPNMSPLAIGDYPYPNRTSWTTRIIKMSLAIIKGNIYTPDSSGRLIVPISTTGVADLSAGILQAGDNAPAPVAEDTDSVQCLAPGSRVLLKAPAGLAPGQDVDLSSSGSVTTADTCMIAAQPRGKGYLGRIFEIYTKNTNGTPKELTATNDLVVIDLGVA